MADSPFLYVFIIGLRRCSRVCAYSTGSIGLNSKINELKVTGNHVNPVKINDPPVYV